MTMIMIEVEAMAMVVVTVRAMVLPFIRPISFRIHRTRVRIHVCVRAHLF